MLCHLPPNRLEHCPFLSGCCSFSWNSLFYAYMRFSQLHDSLLCPPSLCLLLHQALQLQQLQRAACSLSEQAAVRALEGNYSSFLLESVLSSARRIITATDFSVKNGKLRYKYCCQGKGICNRRVCKQLILLIYNIYWAFNYQKKHCTMRFHLIHKKLGYYYYPQFYYKRTEA